MVKRTEIVQEDPTDRCPYCRSSEFIVDVNGIHVCLNCGKKYVWEEK